MIRLQFNSSLQVSWEVLEMVDRILLPDIAQQCQVEVMANCREQAFIIKRYTNAPQEDIAIAFCENRNSDQIVIYQGSHDGFDNQTNLPTDDSHIWETRKYFSYDRQNDAACHIVRFLTQEP